MVQNMWVPHSRKTVLCIDAYDDGVLTGRFYGAEQPAEPFTGLLQFLIKMNALLDETQAPQAYTCVRTFSKTLVPPATGTSPNSIPKGNLATFELQILFRQHTSWQGILIWQEQKLEQSFRSVLELSLLIDSALRRMDGEEAC